MIQDPTVNKHQHVICHYRQQENETIIDILQSNTNSSKS